MNNKKKKIKITKSQVEKAAKDAVMNGVVKGICLACGNKQAAEPDALRNYCEKWGK